MSAPHTPAPWVVRHDEDCGHYSIEANDVVVGQVFYVDNAPCPIGEADARLIASAPALLEAAKHALQFLLPLKNNDEAWSAISHLTAAIASAQGDAA